jgi:putative membrane protein
MNLPKIAHKLNTASARGLFITGTLLAAALTLQAQQSELQKSDARAIGPKDDASCIKQVAQMNAATIKFGQLAAEKAQNAELKQFGEQIEKDHKTAQRKLETLAKKHDVTLATTLDAKCQEEVTKLQGLSGTEFDKEFARGAVQGHAMAIAHLQKAAVEAKDSDLADYTKEMLSKMKHHQEKAREVAKAVGLDQPTIAALETQPPEGVGTSGIATETERGAGKADQKDSKPQP